MFAQANSEHCRHKIFNADWIIDGQRQERSLFAMIRHTHSVSPRGTVVAYADNAAVAEGARVRRFYPDADGHYAAHPESTDYVMKVETHNHPTAHRALSRCRHRFRRRDSRRGRDRHRREAEGGAHGLHGVASALARPRAAVGAAGSAARSGAQESPRSEQDGAARLPLARNAILDRNAAAHRDAARDHAPGPDRRRLVQQRVRTSESSRILPHLRADRRRRSARVSQADHDRGRRRQHRGPGRAQAGVCRRARSSCNSADRAC